MRSVSLRNRQITSSKDLAFGSLQMMRHRFVSVLSDCTTSLDLRLTPQVYLYSSRNLYIIVDFQLEALVGPDEDGERSLGGAIENVCS